MEKMLAGLAKSKKLGTVGRYGSQLRLSGSCLLRQDGSLGIKPLDRHGLGEMVGSAAINTALAGGGWNCHGGIVRTMGARKKLPEEIIPGVDSTEPPQLQLQGN